MRGHVVGWDIFFFGLVWLFCSFHGYNFWDLAYLDTRGFGNQGLVGVYGLMEGIYTRSSGHLWKRVLV